MKTLKERFVDYFDKIFVLTMANRKERIESVIKQFKEISIYDDLVMTGKLEIVETVQLPITQKALNCMAESGDIRFTYNNKEQRIGQFMCASEHYKIIKRSIINGYERILVLEDDVCFLKEFKYIMKALREAPDDFNILHLEGFFWPANEEQESRYLTRLTQNINDGKWVSSDEGFRLYCTAALIYSKTGMERYCSMQEKLFQSPDHPTFWMENSFSYSYPLVMQEKKSVFKSDILNNAVDIEKNNIYLKYYNYENYYHFYENKN